MVDMMPGMGTGTMAGSLFSVDMIHKECFSPPARPYRHGTHLEKGNRELMAPLRAARYVQHMGRLFPQFPISYYFGL